MLTVIGRVWWAPFGGALEVVENPVEVVLVEDEAHALLDAHQAGEPQGLPGAALDADVGHGFLLGEAAFHLGLLMTY